MLRSREERSSQRTGEVNFDSGSPRRMPFGRWMLVGVVPATWRSANACASSCNVKWEGAYIPLSIQIYIPSRGPWT